MGYKLNASQISSLNTTAKKVGANPIWLYKLIFQESGWNPDAKNPLGGARGLIQFTHSTAKRLGYANADDLVNKNPTIETQLAGPVRKYLSVYSPFSSLEDLCACVFFPKNRKNLDAPISKAGQAINSGITTVRQYVTALMKNVNKIDLTWLTNALAALNSDVQSAANVVESSASNAVQEVKANSGKVIILTLAASLLIAYFARR